MRSHSPSRYAALVLMGIGVATWAPPAVADEAAVLQRVTDLNKKAVEAYENLDMDESSRYLRQALELCAAEGLNDHPAKARTHIHLGIVLLGGFKQRDRAIQNFKRALEIDPKIRLTRSLINPEIQAAFDEALRDMTAGKAPAQPAKPTEPGAQGAEPAQASDAAPRKVKGIQHTPVTEARTGTAIAIRAAVDSQLGSDKVVLAYRPEGASDFLARDMEKEASGWYVARIPQPATRGSVVSYYIEARSKGGQPLASSGSVTEPYVVSVSEEAPLASDAPTLTLRRRRGDLEEPGAEGAAGERKYWFSLGLGSGFGWAKGRPEVNPTDKSGQKIDVSGNFASAGLMHFAPEVGLFVTPNLLLSVQGRIQVVTAATEVHDKSCPDNKNPQDIGICPPAHWALAFFGKATWLLGDPKPFRPFLSVSAGGGEIRHVFKLDLKDCGTDGMSVCQDTVLGGVVLLGPGAGIIYELPKGLSAVASLNSLVGVPNLTVNFDLSIGIALAL